MADEKQFPQCKAIIFDCDGLLLDTEPLYNKASCLVLERHGLSGDLYTVEVRQHVVGVCELEGAKEAVQRTGLQLSPADYLKQREEALVDLFPLCEAMPGAMELVTAVRKAGVPSAIATSANRNAFELKLKNHSHWVGLYDQEKKVMTGCQLPSGRGKPKPDIFLRAAELIGFKGREHEILVFEDAPSGSKGAKEAGMTVIAVPDPALPRALYEPHAHEILSSLSEFDPKKYGLSLEL
mmetsp:Transcript_4193/g.5419  ORF Transcript_4193/g.5419 Transcript_4193/m.5419 type:complete len:238 (+) Transcript_4193:16-729(+)